MKRTISPRISREEYDAFLVLLKGDLEFPTTYEGWLERTTQKDAERVAHGYIIEEVVIHPKEFAEYCLGCGQDVSFTMIYAFAVFRGYGHK